MENKTVVLTPDEVKIVQKSVNSKINELDAYLHSINYVTPQNKELDIQTVTDCESILKKLK